MRSWFLILFLLPSLYSLGGKKDSTEVDPEPLYRNVIKWNLTPMLLWSPSNITLSYERILGPRQSVAVSLGYLEFPSLFDDTIANLIAVTSRHKKGINVGLEYRFYLMKRNKRPIPDGIYIAPYASYYGYSFKNNFDILYTTADSAGTLKGNFYCFNLGFELGYQFVFWKRLTLDLVLFGPSMSYYGGNLHFGGTIDPDKISQIDEEIYEEIAERYPFVRSLFRKQDFISKSKLDLLSIGFRYMIQIGFHF